MKEPKMKYFSEKSTQQQDMSKNSGGCLHLQESHMAYGFNMLPYKDKSWIKHVLYISKRGKWPCLLLLWKAETHLACCGFGFPSLDGWAMDCGCPISIYFIYSSQVTLPETNRKAPEHRPFCPKRKRSSSNRPFWSALHDTIPKACQKRFS